MRFFEVDSAVDAIMSAAMVAQGRASQQNKQGKLSMNGFLQMLANSDVVMDYDGFKTVFDTNPALQNVIAKFDKDTITFKGDSDDEGEGYEEPETDIPDDERVSKMAKRAMKTREFVEAKEIGVYKIMGGVRYYVVKNKSGKEKLFSGPTPAAKKYAMTEAELPPHLAKMFGKDGKQVDTRTDVMKQMRDIVANKQASKVKFGDGDQMIDMYTASVLTQIYDKVNDNSKEAIIQRIGTKEKFAKLMPKLFSMLGEGSSPHPKGSKKYKKHMAAMHAGESVNEAWQAFKEGIKKGKPATGKDRIDKISHYQVHLLQRIAKHVEDGLTRREVVAAYPNHDPNDIAKLYDNEKSLQDFEAGAKESLTKERSLTSAEKDKMKHYEKKLPKQDFIDRYGKKEGEAIYYATATKMAKKNA